MSNQKERLISFLKQRGIEKIKIDSENEFIEGCNLTVEALFSVLDEFFDSNRYIDQDLEFYAEKVAEKERITIEEMKRKTRKREIVEARQISMWCMKKYTKRSLSGIGGFFNGKDHATVLHSVKTVNNLMDTSNSFRERIESVKDNIEG